MEGLDAAEANRVLSATDNTSLLCLHEVLASQTSGGMLGRAVPYLCL